MLCESKVRDLDVSHCIQQQVFGLEIAVDHSVGVEVFKCQKDLTCIKPCDVLREALTLPEDREQLSSDHVIHDHVQVPHIMERAPEIDQEGMLHALQNHLLVVGVLDLLQSDDLGLLEDLHCIEP